MSARRALGYNPAACLWTLDEPDNYPASPPTCGGTSIRSHRFPALPAGGRRAPVCDRAGGAGWPRWRMDEAGNLVVTVAATAGLEDRAAVIIQNHLDMVTVKTADKQHDFRRDPLEPASGRWLAAGGSHHAGCRQRRGLCRRTGADDRPGGACIRHWSCCSP